MISSRTRTAIISVVTAAWAVNFAAPFFISDYRPSEAVNGVFLLVVGALFAAKSKGKEDGG